MERSKEYYAFISYKSEDVEWAIWLQHELEHYHLPASFNGRTDIRQELRPVFRDIDELSAGNLPEQIRQALKNSQNLIVVCSPQAAASPWVNQEIETFISLGRTDRIFPFIVEGNSPKEFFPPVLLALPKDEERLGGDASKQGRDIAFVKVVSGMLGVNFDDLWNRYEKEKAENERREREEKERLQIVQSLFLAEKANFYTEEGFSLLSKVLALKALPHNLKNPDRPFVPEAAKSLLRAEESGAMVFLSPDSLYSFSHNENFIVTLSNETEISIWSLDTGDCYYKNIIEESTVVLFDESQELLMSASISDYSIQIQNIKTDNNKFRLHGHKDVITSLSLSQDGRYLLSTSKDCKIILWDLLSKKILGVFLGHSKQVNSAMFNFKCNLVVSASNDKTIRVWDAFTFRQIVVLTGHKKAVNYAGFSGNSNRIVSVSEDKTIKVWERHNNKCLKTLKGHLSEISSAQFYIDDNHVISVSADNTIRVWDVFTGEFFSKMLVRESHYVPSLNVTLTDILGGDIFDFSSLISFGKSISRHISTRKQKHKQQIENEQRMRLHNKRIISKRKLLVAFREENNIQIFNSRVLTDNWVSVTKLEEREGIRFSVDAKGDYICSPLSDGRIKVWSLSTGSVYRLFNKHRRVANMAVFSNDSKIIASNSKDDTIRLWDVQTGELLKSIPHHTVFPYTLLFSPNDRFLLAVSDQNMLKLYDVDTGKSVLSLKAHTSLVKKVIFSPDSQNIISLHEDSIIMLWNIESGKCVISTHGNTASFSTDGKYLVSYNESSKLINIWKVNNGMCVNSIEARYYCLTADGNKIVCVSNDNELDIRKIDENVTLCKSSPLPSKIHYILCPKSEYNGEFNVVLSITDDFLIKIWDVNTLSCLCIFEGHSDHVLSARFSPTGEIIISISESEIRIWDRMTQSCIRVIKRMHEMDIDKMIFDGKDVIFYGDVILKCHITQLQSLIDKSYEQIKNYSMSKNIKTQGYFEYI